MSTSRSIATAKRRGFRIVGKPFVMRFSEGGSSRPAVIVATPGYGNVAFYRSTGRGGRVASGNWVPFNGVSRRGPGGGGWVIKVHGKIPTGVLAQAASWLKRRERLLGKARVLSPSKFGSSEAMYRAVNDILVRHGAMHEAQGRAGFAAKTVNVSPRLAKLVPDKRQRQYLHVLESTLQRLLDRGVPLAKALPRAKEIAARTVNKLRAKRARGHLVCKTDRRGKRGRRVTRCRPVVGPKLVSQGGSRRGWYPGKRGREVYVCLLHGRKFRTKAALLSHYRSHA